MRAREFIGEINSPGELSVDSDLIKRFTDAGWQIDGEGRDQIVLSKPNSKTVLKVVGQGTDAHPGEIRQYVNFFRANQRNPHFPRVGADKILDWKGRRYYAYSQERLLPLPGDEAVMDYLEYAMGELGHGEDPDYSRVPPGLTVEQIDGLVMAIDDMFDSGLLKQHNFDLGNVANIMQRANGQLVIVDPTTSLDHLDENSADSGMAEALVHRGQVRNQDPNDVWHVRDDRTRKLRHHRGRVVLAQARPKMYQDDVRASYQYTPDPQGRVRRSLPSFHWAYIQGNMVNRLPQALQQGRQLWFKRGQGFVYADTQEPFAQADYVVFDNDGRVMAYDSTQPAPAAGPAVVVSPSTVAEGLFDANPATYDLPRRALNVPELIKRGAIFIVDPHGEQGWEPEEEGFSLVTLWNVMRGGWPAEAKQHLRPDMYPVAAKMLNQQGPGTMLYDGKYRQILWSIKKLGIPEEVAFLDVKENFADGRVKGRSRPGRVKRAGASCKGSVTDLRARAKKYGGERGRMYHWCANMKSGRRKSK